MKRYILLFVAIVFIFPSSNESHAWELFDRVIAVVNDRPIVESEVVAKMGQLLRLKKIPTAKMPYHKSRVLDMFIEDSLFVETAEDESIIVSEKKIDDYVEKMMKRQNIENLEEFKERLEKKERITYAEYRDQIKKSLIKEMVMSIAVGVSPPSEQQAREWYNKNSQKVGYEYNINHVFLRLRNNTLAEERRVNNEMKGILNSIRRGMSFEAAAQQFSEDGVSKGRGGSLGWVRLAEMDRILAMQLFGMNRPGQVSNVLKSSTGYHIVKFNGKRIVQYDSIRDMIFNILYGERVSEQMSKWAEQRRKESDVKIYMNEYVMN